MSHDGARSAATSKAGLPRELVHRVRNDLCAAIATTDLLLLDNSIGPRAIRDLKRIRAACLKVMDEINAAA